MNEKELFFWYRECLGMEHGTNIGGPNLGSPPEVYTVPILRFAVCPSVRKNRGRRANRKGEIRRRAEERKTYRD